MALTSKDMANFDPALKIAYDKYVDNIMRGATQMEAALRAGVSINGWQEWVRGAETDPYVIQLMKERLEALDVRQLWNEKLSILKRRELIDDPRVKDSVRLEAAKQLDVLLGHTAIDEVGRVHKVPTLDDLYAEPATEGKPEADNPARLH